MAEYLTLQNLAEEMRAMGKPVGVTTLRYHCQQGNVAARCQGGVWLVSRAEADRVKTAWQRHHPGALKEKPESAA